MDGSEYKRRRIVVEDEDDEEVLSNPDEYVDEQNDPDDEEGEDIMVNWRSDYDAAPELDHFDQEMLADENEYIDESYETIMRNRRSAEQELDELDMKRREMDLRAEHNLDRMNRFEEEELQEEDEADVDEGQDQPLNLEAFDCPLKEWIAEERTRREISRRFRSFLETYYTGVEEVIAWRVRHRNETPMPPLPAHLRVAPPIYPAKIRAMCIANSASLEVSFAHLSSWDNQLAIWLTDVPRDMLQIFDEVLQQVVLVHYPNYTKISQETHVRVTGLPFLDRLRDLRQSHLNNMIRVAGVVTRRTGVFPQMKSVAYDCGQCAALLGPYRITGVEVRPDSCVSCGARGPFKVNQSRTEYGNYQRVTLQETPGSVPPGRVPRYKEVILLGDLIDVARPGEEVDITGIYVHASQSMARRSNGFPVFNTVIEANSVQKRHGSNSTMLSEEDKRKIRELAKDPQIGERIIRSIAPSIYGHRHVKTGVALSLFGGCHKDGGNSGMHRVRGDINILLLGDPGTAKSQILKYAEKTAPRAVFTAGKGASAVGLTAGVHKDPVTREWTLEGGALVLADQGVCLIDEFDKMNEQDRTSIHEAMEQQTISVSKAGIVTSLQARCAVMAAANPIGGRYDPSFSFAENVELTDPILQRFDILCVLQDTVDPIVDERLANFVVGSHMRSHPKYRADDENSGADPAMANNNHMANTEPGAGGDDASEYNSHANGTFNTSSSDGNLLDKEMGHIHDDGPQPLDQGMLRKYIAYARANFKPILDNLDKEKIASLYAELRAASAVTGGVPIAVRHIESIMRMAEANARMHLREHVREDDQNLAIKVMLESFLQSQKVSVRRSLQRSFQKYLTYGEASDSLLMHKLQGLIVEREQFNKLLRSTKPDTEVFISELENRAKELNIFDLSAFFHCKVFKSLGLEVNRDRGVIIKRYLA